jgi:hypothetical protein
MSLYMRTDTGMSDVLQESVGDVFMQIDTELLVQSAVAFPKGFLHPETIMVMFHT